MKRLLQVLVLSTCLWGCVAVCPAQEAGEDPHILVFGITPWFGKAETTQAFTPFVRYLAEQLERPVRLYVAQNYAELGNRLGRGLVHVGYFSPTVYVQTAEKYPSMRYLVTVANERGYYFKGYIIARQDSGIRETHDLRGRSFAFTDVDSTSGFKMPLLLLREQSIEPSTYFSHHFFMGSHAAVLRAVYEGRVAGGAIAHHLLEEFDGRDALTILAETPPLPEGAIAVYGGISFTLEERLLNVLLQMDASTTNRAGTLVMEGMPYKGFSRKDDSFYDVIREMLEALE